MDENKIAHGRWSVAASSRTATCSNVVQLLERRQELRGRLPDGRPASPTTSAGSSEPSRGCRSAESRQRLVGPLGEAVGRARQRVVAAALDHHAHSVARGEDAAVERRQLDRGGVARRRRCAPGGATRSSGTSCRRRRRRATTCSAPGRRPRCRGPRAGVQVRPASWDTWTPRTGIEPSGSSPRKATATWSPLPATTRAADRLGWPARRPGTPSVRPSAVAEIDDVGAGGGGGDQPSGRRDVGAVGPPIRGCGGSGTSLSPRSSRQPVGSRHRRVAGHHVAAAGAGVEDLRAVARRREPGGAAGVLDEPAAGDRRERRERRAEAPRRRPRRRRG